MTNYLTRREASALVLIAAFLSGLMGFLLGGGVARETYKPCKDNQAFVIETKRCVPWPSPPATSGSTDTTVVDLLLPSD